MANHIQSMADALGIDLEQARHALGAFLSFLRDKLGPDLFGQVEGSVPEAKGALSAFEAGPAAESPGGLLEAVTALAGKLLGGDGASIADLINNFTKIGLSAEQIQDFLPRVVEFLKKFVSPELMQKVLGMIPGLDAILGQGATTPSNPPPPAPTADPVMQ